jgi:hypothetical protein
MKQWGLNRSWCAELTPAGKCFLRGRIDTQPDSGPALDVFYLLESGHVYEVQAPVSGYEEHHYFCRVSEEGDVVRISEQEARRWLSPPRA